jgi:23S rRNA (cytosine1962-C5)-methyltransferase
MPDDPSLTELVYLNSPDWKDYELLDSGDGLKLERYGRYTFVRPEPQAIWSPALKESHWRGAHAVFQPTGEESGGRWQFNKPVDPAWTMRYKDLRFQAQATAGRHLGVFPEQANHWDWLSDLIQQVERPVSVLNLFGYTGLATLAAAKAGAKVTHVDASKKAVAWARENQTLCRLEDRPIRWIVDDALKFAQREIRRQAKYDGLILDPPKFGRGPKGEVWEFFELMPRLLEACRQALSARPLFIVITAYAIRASALSLHFALGEIMKFQDGSITSGELTLNESSAGRKLSTAIFTRWQAGKVQPK